MPECFALGEKHKERKITKGEKIYIKQWKAGGLEANCNHKPKAEPFTGSTRRKRACLALQPSVHF